MTQWGNQIKGKVILAQVKQSYEQFRTLLKAKNKSVAIIRFLASAEDSEIIKAKFHSAEISARQKIKTFDFT